jgi:hypothetical protein
MVKAIEKIAESTIAVGKLELTDVAQQYQKLELLHVFKRKTILTEKLLRITCALVIFLAKNNRTR